MSGKYTSNPTPTTFSVPSIGTLNLPTPVPTKAPAPPVILPTYPNTATPTSDSEDELSFYPSMEPTFEPSISSDLTAAPSASYKPTIAFDLTASPTISFSPTLPYDATLSPSLDSITDVSTSHSNHNRYDCIDSSHVIILVNVWSL
jgi:hypothetical protein